jgi:hypothetical protein
MPEQKVGKRGAAALRGRQQRVLRIAAVEGPATSRHHSADLVVQHTAQLAAELHGVLSEAP